jgi:hypothetical protein
MPHGRQPRPTIRRFWAMVDFIRTWPFSGGDGEGQKKCLVNVSFLKQTIQS